MYIHLYSCMYLVIPFDVMLQFQLGFYISGLYGYFPLCLPSLPLLVLSLWIFLIPLSGSISCLPPYTSRST